MRTIEAMRFGDEICLTHNTKTWCTHDTDMVYSQYRHGVLMIQTWCTHDTDMVYSRYRHGVLTIQTWCTHDTDMVYSRYRHGVLMIQTWCTYSSISFNLNFNSGSLLSNRPVSEKVYNRSVTACWASNNIKQ